jgi:hypothetical protein
MVQIYYEITIYIYKAIFSFGGFSLEPPPGAHFPSDPPAGGIAPSNPVGGGGGKSPLSLPHVEGCTVFQGVKSSWGINMAENKEL